MRMNTIKTRILAGILALGMIMPGMTAMADESVTTASQGSLIQETVISGKNLKYNETFTYSITQEGQWDDSGVVANENTATLGTGSVTIQMNQQNGKKDGTSNTNEEQIFRMTNVGGISDEVLKASITEPGVYTYLIKEESHTNNAGLTWSNDQSVYRMRVYAENTGGTSLVYTVTVEQIKNRDGQEITSQKVSKANFTDYIIGEFQLTKQVEGFATQTAFTFNVTPGVLDRYKDVIQLPSTIQYNVVGKDGSTVKSGQTLSLSDGVGQVQLEDGQTAVFTNLPVGTYLTIVEQFGTKEPKSVKTEETRSITSDVIKGTERTKPDVEVTNPTKVTYVNTYPEPTPTGVVTSIAPYVTLVVIAGAAIALYVIIRKKMR